MSSSHSHEVIDPAVLATERGIAAVKASWWLLLATAIMQGAVVLKTGSVSLLADTLHNLTDAATAIPLWLAFRLANTKPNARFTYGYGRAEDLAGLVVLLLIFASAVGAAYVAIQRLYHPQAVSHLLAVAAASVIGFLGNEAVAVLRIRTGREIGSAALVADGYHARADGLTSLAVLVGTLGIWLGYPIVDAIIGLVISGAIVHILWDSGKDMLMRFLDAVDPDIPLDIRKTVAETPEVQEVTEVRVRWIGHRLHAEVNMAVASDLSVERAHTIADQVRHRLLHRLTHLSSVTIHVDPVSHSGEVHHALPHTH